MRELELFKFIEKHGNNWKEVISLPPYCIKVIEEDGLTLLKYDLLESDFNQKVVHECRGIILDGNNNVVCYPFDKFFNYSECFASKIDWSSACVQEKIDGSIMKVYYYNNEWKVATNAKINAFNAQLMPDAGNENVPFSSFGDLFEEARKSAGLDYNNLNKDYTYIFELVSPYNKVVIPYDEIKIYHIGTRNNKTLLEEIVDIGVEKPQLYPLSTAEECLTAAKNLPSKKEGFVVVDKFFNRVKIKNPVYVAFHMFKSNGEPSERLLVAVIRENEVSEVLGYFPEYSELITNFKNAVDSIINGLTSGVQEISKMTFNSQKEFALAVKDRPFSHFYFLWNKDKTLEPKEWLWNNSDEKVRELINLELTRNKM